MQQKININIVVDVIAALADNTLHNHIFMMDNSIYDSTCQGTQYLSTACRPGQIIQWNIYALDLQTPVAIKNISFATQKDDEIKEEKLNLENDPDSKVWNGIVPWYMVPNNSYSYRLAIQMGEGSQSIMSIDTANLIRI